MQGQENRFVEGAGRMNQPKGSRSATESLSSPGLSLAAICGGILPSFDSVKLKDYRREAFANLEKVAPLNPRNEDYKYLNLQANLKPLVRIGPAVGIDSVASLSSSGEKCVIVNGRYSSSLSTLNSKWAKIFEVSQEIPESFFSYVKAVEGSKAGLKVLSDATFSQVLFVDVPEGESYELEVVHLTSEVKESNAEGDFLEYLSPRLFVNVGKSAKLQLVEHFLGHKDDGYFTNHFVEFKVAGDAKVEHVKIQRDSVSAIHGSSIFVDQEESSNFKTIAINFGASIARNEIYPAICGEQAESWLIGANVVSGGQIVDNFTVIDHIAPNCESHELYKEMYGGSSKGVFSGTIIVRNEAQKTNAYQSNSSLLCSSDSESNSRPQLKIWADDVKCSHGATVGQLDDESLFYLMARGIPENEARIILTRAYVSEAFSHISDVQLKANVELLLEEKLKELL